MKNHQSLLYTVTEEAPRGTLVGNLRADVTRMIMHSAGADTLDTTLDLTITNWRNRAVQQFLLDSGELRVATPPDREFICSNGRAPDSRFFSDSSLLLKNAYVLEDKNIPILDESSIVRGSVASDTPCTISLKIAYTVRKRAQAHTEQSKHSNEPGLLSVQIMILDINDHSPVFPQQRISTELGELSSIPGKTSIDLPTAFDPDAGPNGTIVYWYVYADHANKRSSMEDSKGSASPSVLSPFRLEADPLRLLLTDPLDWESQTEYRIMVYARDFGQPTPRVGQLEVHVSVRDENDNAPFFKNDSYIVSVDESVLRGSIILELTADDKDSKSNGQVRE